MLLRFVLVLAAAAAMAGQFLQERYRLAVVERLPPQKARDEYEQRRRRSDRAMLVVTIVFSSLGLVALSSLIWGWPWKP
jgi:fatty acid desaturase